MRSFQEENFDQFLQILEGSTIVDLVFAFNWNKKQKVDELEKYETRKKTFQRKSKIFLTNGKLTKLKIVLNSINVFSTCTLGGKEKNKLTVIFVLAGLSGDKPMASGTQLSWIFSK